MMVDKKRREKAIKGKILNKDTENDDNDGWEIADGN